METLDENKKIRNEPDNKNIYIRYETTSKGWQITEICHCTRKKAEKLINKIIQLKEIDNRDEKMIILWKKYKIIATPVSKDFFGRSGGQVVEVLIN